MADKNPNNNDSKSTTDFSPGIPIPLSFSVPARIKTLHGYLDPNNADYQPERQHVNIRAVIKLYEEGKISGMERITVIGGEVAPYREAFTAKTGSWTEGVVFQRAQRVKGVVG